MEINLKIDSDIFNGMNEPAARALLQDVLKRAFPDIVVEDVLDKDLEEQGQQTRNEMDERKSLEKKYEKDLNACERRAQQLASKMSDDDLDDMLKFTSERCRNEEKMRIARRQVAEEYERDGRIGNDNDE